VRAPRELLGWSTAALAAAITFWHVPGELRGVWRDIRNASAETVLERRLRPARVVGLDRTEIFLVARDLIPPGDIYYADVGEGPERALDWVRPFATYWLLPRRRTDDLGEARWILSYEGDLQALGLPYRRIVTVAPGVALAEVRS
jgi:hypothetical protein